MTGTIRSNTGTNLNLRIEWSSVPHTATNSSTVTCNVFLEHYDIYSSALDGSYVKVAGQTFVFKKGVTHTQNSRAETKLASCSFEVSHSSNGTASVTVSAGWVFRGTYGGVYIDTVSASGSAVLDTISRVSGATCPSSVNVGSALKFSVTSYDASFKHKVKLTAGSLTFWSGFLTGASPSWSVPNEVSSAFPSGKSGTAQLTLYTYSSAGTLIGSSSVGSVTLNIPDTDTFRPSFFVSSSVSSSISALVQNSLYTAGLTSAAFGFSSMTARYGASVKSCSVKCASKTKSVNTQGSSATILFPLETGGEHEFTVTVTDSRGLSKSQRVTLSVKSYFAPSLVGASIFRCDGEGVASDSGTYIFADAEPVVCPVEGGSFTNVGTPELAVTSHTDGNVIYRGALTEGGVLCGGLSAFSSYDVTITLTDSIGKSAQYRTIVPTSRVDFHLNDGAARLGGYCERSGFECDWDAFFNGQVSFGGSAMGDFVLESGSSGIWIWRKWASGIAECFGTTATREYVLSNSFGTGLYITPQTEEYKNAEAFPEGLFCQPPTVQATPCHKEYSYFITPRGNPSAASTADYYICGEHTGIVYRASIALHAVGRWR